MRSWVTLIILFTAIVFVVSAVIPQDALTAEKGNARKGKYFFKKVCKECHGTNGVGKELTPMSKTSKQWEDFFVQGEHADKSMADLVEEKNVIHVKTFLINHAADSDQPETCG